MTTHYYLLLIAATLAIVALTILTWWKTRSVVFPLGMAFSYYLSLYGAWFLVYDKSGGDSGKHYSYLEAKMFPVNLDDFYFLGLLIYALFLITIAATTLFLVRPAERRPETLSNALEIAHTPIILVCACAAIGSFLIVRDGLATAAELGVSPYTLMRRGFGDVPTLFTIHQILNRIALVPATIGLAIILSGQHPLLLRGRRSLLAALGYTVVIAGMITLAFLLGYKSEIFYSGMVGCLFYLANARRPRWAVAGLGGTAVVIGMFLVDKLRWISTDELSGAVLSTESLDLSAILKFAASSNEAFASHFSLYGVLSLDVPITYGLSFVSLIASLVPRIVWPDRPSDIYAYYAEGVNAIPGQGYTIHHATGWYLNFGVPGVVIGAVIFSWIWARLFNLHMRTWSIDSRIMRVFSSISPWTFSAYIPFLMHAGPEVYKGLVVEALALPTFVIAIGAISCRFASHPQSSATASK